MIISNIALRIYGGAIDKGLDAEPIMAVGNIPKEFCPILPTLVDEQQVWIITHAQAYTLYATSSKRCHTIDDQPGLMLICLFFPPQKRMADGNSPLALLDEIIDMFSVQGLRDGKLPNMPIDNAPFKSLLAKYRLEDRPVSLPIMQGHSPASLCVNSKNQLDALMRHSRYEILASVGCLELGFKCKSSISLKPSAKKPKKDEASKVQPNPLMSKETIANSVSSNTGGLPLDDDPDEKQPKSWGKKLLKVVALIIGILFSLFAALVVIGMILNDSNNKEEAITVSYDRFQSDSFDQTDTDEKNSSSEDRQENEVLTESETEAIAEDSEAEQRARNAMYKADLIRIINTKDLVKCRQHPGWNLLTKSEKLAVDVVLAPDYYKHHVNAQGMKMLYAIKERPFNFTSLEDVKAVYHEIKEIIQEYQKE